MTSYVADGNRPGFEHWTQRNNLKEAAKTFSYLSQHNLLNYEEFQNHISDLEASIQAADDQILQTQKAIQNQKIIKIFKTQMCYLFYPILVSYIDMSHAKYKSK